MLVRRKLLMAGVAQGLASLSAFGQGRSETLMDTLKGPFKGPSISGSSSRRERGQKSDEVTSSSITVFPLWPQGYLQDSRLKRTEHTGQRGQVFDVMEPRLLMHNFPAGKTCRGAVIVVPGGGYCNIEEGVEGAPTARWLMEQGFQVFELLYRLPISGWSDHAVLSDGQRAVRVVRHLAEQYHYPADRVGMLGFSAGGHLAAITATQCQKRWEHICDGFDTLSARPDFVGLIYPVLTLMAPYNHNHSSRQISRHLEKGETVKDYSAEFTVDKDTSPMFLAHAEDDPIAPVENSLRMYTMLRQAHVKAELHIFQQGGHGWFRKHKLETYLWQPLFLNWVQVVFLSQ
ncbi:alpha/beta hydrolase [Entomobacter blattae]|uniref:Prolyl oligopeptidase family protein n=1 Tax=Entomobacter blattae TaxID=2762277 RepID=A0A7H1NQE7_9PROT|nr:alpha/beta hydrolase [Entomobacter blattae]QNT78007.1 Prolyl oligopeptidase family protein [Entomobacter blattae]